MCFNWRLCIHSGTTEHGQWRLSGCDTSSIGRGTSSIGRGTSSIGRGTSYIGRGTSSIGRGTSSIGAGSCGRGQEAVRDATHAGNKCLEIAICREWNVRMNNHGKV